MIDTQLKCTFSASLIMTCSRAPHTHAHTLVCVHTHINIYSLKHTNTHSHAPTLLNPNVGINFPSCDLKDK